MHLTNERVAQFARAPIHLRNTATDEAAAENPAAYDRWENETEYAVGERVQYDGRLYKCLAAHTAQESWTPDTAGSLWARVLPGQSGTEIGEWVQPDSTNPYMRGDTVSYDGELWVSVADGNVWEPGTYGWEVLQ